MESIIDTRKVNRSLFAYRVVDVHNDEFGFAQDGYIYTYVTDSNTKTKGTTWLRMQSTGERGKDRRKYFLYFGDETEYTAVIDKNNDIYDLEGNYVASLVRSKFIISIIVLILLILLLTGLATYLGGSMIMDTSNPFSQDKTIHLQNEDSTTGQGSEEVDIDLLDDLNNGKFDETADDDQYKGSLVSKTNGKNKLIWPGQKGEYVFYVQNDGSLPLDYQISFALDNASKIPMRYKLLVDGEYVAGSSTEWVDIKDINLTKQTIAPGVSAEYTIVWEWEDKGTSEGDEFDTKIGIEGVAKLLLHTTVYFEESI